MSKGIVLGLLAVSLLPVWRDTRAEGGLNFWQWMAAWLSGPREHITVEEARRNYQEYLAREEE